MKATTSLILDTRRKKVSNTYSIKVRVIFNRKYRDYITRVDISEEAWKDLENQRLTKSEKQLKEKLNGIYGKAINIVNDLKSFSFEKFEKQFYDHKISDGSLANYYSNYIAELKKRSDWELQNLIPAVSIACESTN